MLERSTTLPSGLRLEVHHGIPADWPGIDSLDGASAHVFQTREFLEVWAATFAPAAAVDIRFVTVRDAGGAPLLRLPLGIETRGGLRMLGFADQGCGDYNGPILYATDIAWTAELAAELWQAVEAALPPADIVRLEKMPAVVEGRVNPLFLIAGEANPESCHGSNLTLPWPEIEATQVQLKTLKRKARALEKVGEVRFFVVRDAAERQRVLTRLFEQKQRRFEDTRVPGFAESPETRIFFERASAIYADSGHLHLGALEVGGEIVATSWTVAVGDRLYELMIGFESGEWAKYSPGRVLNLRMLQWAQAEGYRYLDHGIGDESWKQENCDTHVPLRRMNAVRTGKGRRHVARTALVAKIRDTALYQRLRPYKWIVKRALRRG